MKELVLGGVKSGKSRFAEERAGLSGLAVTYLATARAGDAEMRRRIEAHRRRRPTHWTTLEIGDGLAGALSDNAGERRCLLVDCLTLWLTGLIERPAALEREREALLETLPSLPGRIILVSNEVGLGVVPMGAVPRRFVDEAGILHQRLARICDRVVFTAGGLPWVLKESVHRV